jgi:hypothetical protein
MKHTKIEIISERRRVAIAVREKEENVIKQKIHFITSTILLLISYTI